VFAQAVLESGNFTSKLFQSANNLFGMKIPSVRESTAIGQTKSGYSKYDDWNFSVYDYFLWQDYMFKKHGDLTKSQYLALLGRIYAEDKRYVSSIKRVIGEHQRILN
jgi:flagellum-specific peptidoglycan hydrolase FlgJ